VRYVPTRSARRLEILIPDNVEYGEPDGARHGVAAVGVEVLHAVIEGAAELARRHHGAQRMPVPIGLPIVTMSGTTPWVSKAQKRVPARPNPVWTSSAMHTPPAARTWAYAARQVPAGRTICPAQLRIDSAANAPDAAAGTADAVDGAGDMPGVPAPGVDAATAIEPAIAVRSRHNVHVRGSA